MAVDDTLGNNNGAIDPGEPIRITVTLTEPLAQRVQERCFGYSDTDHLDRGVVIIDGNSTYPAIPAQGSAAGDTFQFNVPLIAACGQSLRFTVTSTSTLGVKAVDFSFRVGAAEWYSCADHLPAHDSVLRWPSRTTVRAA